jgi:hypothetical protein
VDVDTSPVSQMWGLRLETEALWSKVSLPGSATITKYLDDFIWTGSLNNMYFSSPFWKLENFR